MKPKMRSSSAWALLLQYVLQLAARASTAVSMEPKLVRVETQYGPVEGTRRTVPLNINKDTLTDTVDEFLGIPYATPPVGNLRLRPPEPVKSWKGVLNATSYGSVCPQDSNFTVTQQHLQSEDCLYLNIYSPFEFNAPTTLYPVMVFIHGGSYLYGSGNRYNGSALVQYGVVLVAINYRLGALGFLSTGDDALSGNYGLLDQIAALRWVRDNIGAFRGDKTRVTIFGSSAGGASVGLLLFSNITKGLFKRVIAQSGTANAMWATHTKPASELREDFVKLANSLGCYSSSDNQLLDCIRQADWRDFTANKVCKWLKCNEVDPLFKPVVDGVLLRHTVAEYLKHKSFSSVDYMTGTVRSEFGEHYIDGYTPDDLAKEVDSFLDDRYEKWPYLLKVIKYEYTNWTQPHYNFITGNESERPFYHQYSRAEVLSDMGLVAPTGEMAGQLAARPGMRVYLYHLDNNLVSYHSVELNYVFGTPLIGGAVDEMAVLQNFTDVDRKYCEIFMTLWTDFATYGDPTTDTRTVGVRWTPLHPRTMEYLHVKDGRADMRTHLRAQKVALWNTLLPALVPHTMTKHHHDLSRWIFLGFSVLLLVVVVTLVSVIVHGSKKGKKYSQLLRGNSGTSYSVNL